MTKIRVQLWPSLILAYIEICRNSCLDWPRWVQVQSPSLAWKLKFERRFIVSLINIVWLYKLYIIYDYYTWTNYSILGSKSQTQISSLMHFRNKPQGLKQGLKIQWIRIFGRDEYLSFHFFFLNGGRFFF